MRKLLIVIALILTACGSNGPIMVDTQEVSYDKLQSMCKNLPCKGHSEWGYYPEGQKWCIIYLMPYSEYENPRVLKPTFISLEHFYNTTYGHEMRHCRDGDWHD